MNPTRCPCCATILPAENHGFGEMGGVPLVVCPRVPRGKVFMLPAELVGDDA